MPVAPRVVLLVNGEEDNRAMYRAVLEHRGFTVVEAEDGAAGLRLAQVVKPDLVVTDVRYTDDANLELIESLRTDERLRDVAVIVVTAGVVAETEQRARAAGCARFFIQPLEPTRLLAAIEELIGSPHRIGMES
jgi:CheY-like chemotaxis protein